MNGMQWLVILERFFFDGRKRQGSEHSISVDDEVFFYTVPLRNGCYWLDFKSELLANENRELSVDEVANFMYEFGMSLPIPVLKFLANDY